MRTLKFEITIPGIPDGMTNETVLDWVKEEIGHPHDAYFEASVTVKQVGRYSDPERDGNGCMIYGKGETE